VAADRGSGSACIGHVVLGAVAQGHIWGVRVARVAVAVGWVSVGQRLVARVSMHRGRVRAEHAWRAGQAGGGANKRRAGGHRQRGGAREGTVVVVVVVVVVVAHAVHGPGGRTVLALLRKLDHEGTHAARELYVVEAVDGKHGMLVLVKVHKAHAAAGAVCIAQHSCLDDGAVRGEPLEESGVVSVRRQVADVQIRVGGGLGARSCKAHLAIPSEEL
jgi:hypothetical protein